MSNQKTDLSITVAKKSRVFNEKGHFEPGPAWVIVQKLTTEIIYEAVEAYMNDSWLKLSYFGNDIDISVFDKLQAEEMNPPNLTYLQAWMN